MKVLLDGLPLTGLLTGVSRYVRSLYLRIIEEPSVSVRYFTGGGVVDAMPEQAEPEKWIRLTDMAWSMPAPLTAAYQSYQWLRLERAIRKAQRSDGYDVFHGTAFTPAKAPDTPQVFTLHDLSLITLRHMHPKERVLFADLFFKRRMRWADQIITPSDYIRQEAIDKLGLDPDRVTAIPEAPDPFFAPRPDADVDATLEKLGLERGYLLFVGTLEPRKNIGQLIEALALMHHDPPAVLTGWKGWGDKPWLHRAEELGVRDRLRTTGYVSEEDLACLYAGAGALVYPSIYEGFGLPLLEAMACGCPVVCSTAASLPEVAGEAALLAPPDDPGALAARLDAVTGDAALQQSLREKGIARAAQFSWKAAAQATVEVFHRATEGKR